MIHAYNKLYLNKARSTLASLFDYAVYDCGLSLSTVWDTFRFSDIGHRFEVGDPSIVAGRSGVELAMSLFNVDKEHHPRYDKTPEYWVGWAIGYYQWYRNLHFDEISLPIDVVRTLYNPYHEMDILQFCDQMDILLDYDRTTSKLKRIRMSMGLSQSELALLTDIPIRTIQQYEQKQKDINGARAEYVILLARALDCDPIDLLE